MDLFTRLYGSAVTVTAMIGSYYVQVCGSLSFDVEVTRRNAGTLEFRVTTTSYFLLAEKMRLKMKYYVADVYINRSGTVYINP